MAKVRLGIYGATGYTGFELLKLLQRHPQTELVFLTSESNAGARFSDVFACPFDYPLVSSESAPLDQIDVAFLCLPHGASMDWVRRVRQAGVRAIDLSADFRLTDPQEYRRWYKEEHKAPELLGEAVYGLTELRRDEIRTAGLVANPGCYPTTAILGLYPLVKQGLASGQVIVDAKSGVSGAGRSPSLKTHFVEAHDNFSPYNIGHVHRHIAEMEQELGRWGRPNLVRAAPLRVIFSPHLLPINQGILSTIYVQLPQPWTENELVSLYRETYAGERFIQILPPGQLATLRHTVYSNRVAISVTRPDDPSTLIVCVSEDNLIKGASGQALQNMNVMFGLEESLGLL
ncbi:MAG: N-acetyl-gamma-glutamyl-phosphate reductase [Chloroflexi bacterium]|nr:N-acetyl-gamma-glutamyl-phosphate reductase [Chloroflexota bacterium]